MALALVSTPGAASANVFCTLAEAEAYMETLVFPGSWSTATETQKQAALVQAARLMGSLPWKGQKATSTQALSWPRYGMEDADGYAIDSVIIPQAIKDANAEFAMRLLAKDRAADGKTGMSVGSIRTSDKHRSLFPPSVTDLVRVFLTAGYGCCVPLVRG
jgi:hypothetical protein